jgi:hypothetical protein
MRYVRYEKSHTGYEVQIIEVTGDVSVDNRFRRQRFKDFYARNRRPMAIEEKSSRRQVIGIFDVFVVADLVGGNLTPEFSNTVEYSNPMLSANVAMLYRTDDHASAL